VTPGARSERALWLRPALFAVFLASLPLGWRESAPTSCDGTPLGPKVSESGWHLLTLEPGTTLVIAFLIASALALSFVAARARLVTRIVGHLVAAVACLMLFLLCLFAATFSMFTPVRLREGAYVGLASLALGTVEALSRAGVAFAHWFRERSSKVDRDPEVP